ncbi:MAG: NEW3 domain-containing protein [Caulobacteraceae bacterium]
MKIIKKILLLFIMLAILMVSSISAAFAAETGNAEFTTGCSLSSGESKTIALYILNEDTKDHTYKLTAEGATNNYEIYFASGGASAGDVKVPPGANAQIDLNIRLKDSASVNKDKLFVKAVRDDGKVNTIDFSILINKDYVLSVSSMLNKIDILNGKSAEFTFSITNNGSKNLKSVKMVPELPYKWIAIQGDGAVINLKPGETGTLKMTVEVPSSQAAGNFTAKFIAVSDETKSEQISIPVTVRTSSNIAYWMIGFLILIAGFTLIQFKRYGRR